jgi:hypothetical protein
MNYEQKIIIAMGRSPNNTACTNLKGVFSKPSGKRIVAPNLCFLS